MAHELRRRLEQERALFETLSADPRQWTRDRVGTIHTVQGREADAVLLVLGAPNANQHGARHWAAEAPNILNVATSRARQNLYVIGSQRAWASVGHARELGTLPVETPELTERTPDPATPRQEREPKPQTLDRRRLGPAP